MLKEKLCFPQHKFMFSCDALLAPSTASPHKMCAAAASQTAANRNAESSGTCPTDHKPREKTKTSARSSQGCVACMAETHLGLAKKQAEKIMGCPLHCLGCMLNLKSAPPHSCCSLPKVSPRSSGKNRSVLDSHRIHCEASRKEKSTGESRAQL